MDTPAPAATPPEVEAGLPAEAPRMGRPTGNGVASISLARRGLDCRLCLVGAGEPHKLELEGTKMPNLDREAAGAESASPSSARDVATASPPVAVPVMELAAAVEVRIGALSIDEQVRLFGASQAAAGGGGASGMLPGRLIEEVADAVLAGRAGPCGFCGARFADHTLTVATDEASVWCASSSLPRPVPEWLGVHAGVTRADKHLAVAMWVGIPILSLGLLGWLPALFAGLVLRRPGWLVGAAVLAALAVADLVLAGMDDPSPAVGAVSLALWAGSTVYGAVQVRPWLAALPSGAPDWLREAGAWLGRMVAELKADAARRAEARALAAWHEEDEQRRFAVWCSEVVAGDTAGFGGSPISLRPSESLLWAGSGWLIEPRRSPGQYTAGPVGTSARIGQGQRANVSSRMGTYQPGAELQTPVDAGAIVVTNQRIVFAGGMKTREWSLGKLLNFQRSGDGRVTLLPVSNRATVSGVRVVTDSVRFGTALHVASAAQTDDLPGLREELKAHLERHQQSKP